AFAPRKAGPESMGEDGSHPRQEGQGPEGKHANRRRREGRWGGVPVCIQGSSSEAAIQEKPTAKASNDVKTQMRDICAVRAFHFPHCGARVFVPWSEIERVQSRRGKSCTFGVRPITWPSMCPAIPSRRACRHLCVGILMHVLCPLES